MTWKGTILPSYQSSKSWGRTKDITCWGSCPVSGFCISGVEIWVCYLVLAYRSGRCLSCRSAAILLLGRRVRIPPEAWISISCECCVWSSRGFCVGLITRPLSPTDCSVSECDREASIIRRPWSTIGCCAVERRRKVILRPYVRPTLYRA